MARPTTRPGSRWAAPTYGIAGLVFVGALGGLAAQVSAGEDPMLGAPVQEATIPQPHYVVTRRVEKVRVVVRRVRDLPPLAPKVVAAPASTWSAPAGATAPAYSAPARTGSGGSTSTAPAPAAAPAPPVAAPVTRAS